MKDPIITSFRLFGLHGYKDVEIEFPGPARIIIAENGTGKTTILAAIYAFLKRDFYRLAKIRFDSIQCVVKGVETPLTVSYDDIRLYEANPELEKLTRFSTHTASDIRDAIMRVGVDGSFTEDPVLSEIYQRSPYDGDEFTQIMADVLESVPTIPSPLSSTATALSQALGSTELLYLPTYRRVELPSAKTLRRNSSRIRLRQPLPPMDGIQYGLRDVQDRLAEILNDIQRYSNNQYRTISASIIDDALGGKIRPGSHQQAELPDIETLRLFFSRVEAERSTTDRLESLKRLYETGAIHEPDQLVLRYFLSKLNAVVDRTKQLESNVETFVEKVNVYLKLSSDEKSLTYDSNRMKVIVRNTFTGDEIDLDALSSGEKQVISLLSHLYLDPGQKIILIDEPELSLSIDWQKRLLPDVMSAPSCAQLLAITHSPFVFDNELDPYAGPMRIRRHVPKEAHE